MSDVRRELLNIGMAKGYGPGIMNPIADAILEQFDVQEKPVVTDLRLGQMAENAYTSRSAILDVGALMRAQLEAAGLRIVKVEDDK